MCSASLLVEPAKGKVAAMSLRPGRDTGPWALDWAPAARRERSWAAGGCATFMHHLIDAIEDNVQKINISYLLSK